MINIQLSVAEAVSLSAIAGANLRDRIVKAIEIAMGVNQSCNVTITKINPEKRIQCIKSIRLHTGCGLKEAKECTDIVMGRYDSYAGHWVGAKSHAIKLNNPQLAESLLRELVDYGCEGCLS